MKTIAEKIGDREATIEIGIADHFSNGDRDRDRNLNFGDRANALSSYNGKFLKIFWIWCHDDDDDYDDHDSTDSKMWQDSLPHKKFHIS